MGTLAPYIPPAKQGLNMSALFREKDSKSQMGGDIIVWYNQTDKMMGYAHLSYL